MSMNTSCRGSLTRSARGSLRHSNTLPSAMASRTLPLYERAPRYPRSVTIGGKPTPLAYLTRALATKPAGRLVLLTSLSKTD
jgi:hypothetical protein